MQRFAQLYQDLDETTRTNEKVEAMMRYFKDAPPEDAAWTAFLIAGKKFNRSLSSRRLRDWVAEETNLPPWLVEECYQSVGDLSETLALLLPDQKSADPPALHTLIESRIQPLHSMTEAEQKKSVIETWRMLDPQQRYLFHKLITASWRVGVARSLLVRALARIAEVDEAVMAHRIGGRWKPIAADYLNLLSGERGIDDDHAKPYPFLLSHSLADAEPASLGPIDEWQLEWKWDGIRAQLIRRGGKTVVWSRGDESVDTAFPELHALGSILPNGSVLDGEILAWDRDRPLPFAMLQRRLNRKNVEPMLFADVPIVFLAYDVLELAGEDVRPLPLSERRAKLEAFAETHRDLKLSPLVRPESWEQIPMLMDDARNRGVEGLMLKKRESPYATGRPRGLWWKLKVQPYTVDCVLIAAQPGHGRRAGLFTDYTFAVRDGEELVPVAKAYSGLTDEEIDQADKFIRAHTTGRFGPVRSVEPKLIFELGFEGIAESDRHKSGIALRFPRMLRWRTDKPLAEIDTIQTLRELLAKANAYGKT